MFFPGSNTLSNLVGAVSMTKPNADPSATTMYINQRLNYIFNYRTYWSGGIQRGVMSCPAQYSTGTLTTATGSSVVAGQSTAWPVSDVVNTVLSAAVRQIGNQAVTPASMTNIIPDTWLYVDSAGVNPEIVYVLSTTPETFTASFRYPHDISATLTCSSLAGQTMRFGYQIPNYLITAVIDSTTLLIEFPYAGEPLTANSYTILKNLYNFTPYVKELLSVVDPQQGISLEISYPLQRLNMEDPQRSSLQFPLMVIPHSMSPAGTLLYEIWPAPTTVRQLYYEAYVQPQELRAPGDRLPPYISPDVIIAGATADALRSRVGTDDKFYDPQAADAWDMRFRDALDRLVNADNCLYNQAYTWTGGMQYPSGATYDRSHDRDSFYWNV